MASVKRWAAATVLLILGLIPLIFSALRSITKLGYKKRNKQKQKQNFLIGSDKFIDKPSDNFWSAGYAERSLTPNDTSKRRYFLGGFLKFPAQEGTDVLDDLRVRAVCLDDNSGRCAVAFAWVDAIGLMNNDIKDIRAKLSDITKKGQLISIDIGSTHIHSGIDTQGIWGNIPKSGRNKKYIASLKEKTAEAIREAYIQRTKGTLCYSSKAYPQLFKDLREPYSLDEKVHLFRFIPEDSNKREIYIANFGAHGINLGWHNTKISADFPYYIEQKINNNGADFIFIQGAVGGGIHTNMGAEIGIDPSAPTYEKMKAYSAVVADMLSDLAVCATPIEPILNIIHKQIDFEVNNFIFRLVESCKLCNATAFKENEKIYMTSEIGYVEIGKTIKILQVPGEILPEIVYGNFYHADKAYNHTEYPYPELKSLFDKNDNILVFGLCNDAIGYIVPDNDYSSKGGKNHYEESVSTGSKSASTLSKAFIELINHKENIYE